MNSIIGTAVNCVGSCGLVLGALLACGSGSNYTPPPSTPSNDPTASNTSSSTASSEGSGGGGSESSGDNGGESTTDQVVSGLNQVNNKLRCGNECNTENLSCLSGCPNGHMGAACRGQCAMTHSSCVSQCQ